MNDWNAIVELDIDYETADDDALLEPVRDVGGALAGSETGKTLVIMTVPADSLRQALGSAFWIIDTSYRAYELRSLKVIATADYDRTWYES